MSFHLHLGAHKTATTFLQAQLHDHPEALAAASVGYVPIARLRRQFTGRFDLAARTGPLAAPLFAGTLRRRLSALTSPLSDRRIIVLSDENLAGLIADNARTGRLYPAIGARARLLSTILRDDGLKVFFAIRPQADHLVSAWLQMAARGKVMPFGQYLARFSPDRPGWAEPVRQLAESLGPDRVTVWTYDWFREMPERALAELAPGVAISADTAAFNRTVLPSLTAKGLAVMQALEKTLSRDEFQRMAKLMRGFRFDPPDEKIAITDEALIARWGERYRADLAEIAASGVRLLVAAAEQARPSDV